MEHHMKKHKDPKNLQNIDPNEEKCITKELKPMKRKIFEENSNLTQGPTNFDIKKPRKQDEEKIANTTTTSTSTSPIGSSLLNENNKKKTNELQMNNNVSATSTSNFGIVDDINIDISADVNLPSTSSGGGIREVGQNSTDEEIIYCDCETGCKLKIINSMKLSHGHEQQDDEKFVTNKLQIKSHKVLVNFQNIDSNNEKCTTKESKPMKTKIFKKSSNLTQGQTICMRKPRKQDKKNIVRIYDAEKVERHLDVERTNNSPVKNQLKSSSLSSLSSNIKKNITNTTTTSTSTPPIGSSLLNENNKKKTNELQMNNNVSATSTSNFGIVDDINIDIFADVNLPSTSSGGGIREVGQNSTDEEIIYCDCETGCKLKIINSMKLSHGHEQQQLNKLQRKCNQSLNYKLLTQPSTTDYPKDNSNDDG